jgi:transcription antitermination factor NusG
VDRDDARWFVLWTHSNSERLVDDQLRGKGFETFLPLIKAWSRRRGVQSTISVPMFPGYVFVRHALDKRSSVDILSARGVVRLLGERWDRPASVSGDEIDTIRRVADAGVPVSPHPFLAAGQPVRIVDGPLTGVEGILVSINPRKGLLVVSVEILQRSVAVEIETTQVRPLAASVVTAVNLMRGSA